MQAFQVTATEVVFSVGQSLCRQWFVKSQPERHQALIADSARPSRALVSCIYVVLQAAPNLVIDRIEVWPCSAATSPVKWNLVFRGARIRSSNVHGEPARYPAMVLLLLWQPHRWFADAAYIKRFSPSQWATEWSIFLPQIRPIPMNDLFWWSYNNMSHVFVFLNHSVGYIRNLIAVDDLNLYEYYFSVMSRSHQQQLGFLFVSSVYTVFKRLYRLCLGHGAPVNYIVVCIVRTAVASANNFEHDKWSKSTAIALHRTHSLSQIESLALVWVHWQNNRPSTGIKHAQIFFIQSQMNQLQFRRRNKESVKRPAVQSLILQKIAMQHLMSVRT